MTHYERAVRAHLTEQGVPFVAVDEARRAITGGDTRPLRAPGGGARPGTIKTFDLLLYGRPNVLLELKGRKLPAGSKRLENWVTQDDVDSLLRWEGLFGREYVGAFAFVYRCEGEPPDPLFEQVWRHREAWYAIRTIAAGAYAAVMRVRSRRWGTVSVPTGEFERLSGPLLGPADAHHAHHDPDSEADTNDTAHGRARTAPAARRPDPAQDKPRHAVA